MLARYSALLLAAFIAVLAPAAWAQDAPKPNPPENRWSDSAEIVVPAPTTVVIKNICPAMWRLNKGETTLWVMPTLTAVPSNMKWDPACFKRRIKGAQFVLIESIPESVPKEDEYLPKDQYLENQVTPAAYERLKAASRRLNVPLSQLKGTKPVWAGMAMVGAAYSKANLHWEFYPANLPGIVRGAGIPMKAVRLYTGGPYLRNIRNQLQGADAEACMLSDLNRAEWDVEAVPLIAKAWSKSDMKGVIQNFPNYTNDCVPKGQGDVVANTNVQRWKLVLDSALEVPGKVVAVVPMEWFLYRGAVLDQLKAEGVSVSAPKDSE